MINIIFLIIGLGLGYIYRSLRDFMYEVREKLTKKRPEVGITPGLYHHANENKVNQDGETGFVSPKTPQLLEWEEQERLRQEQLRVGRYNESVRK